MNKWLFLLTCGIFTTSAFTQEQSLRKLYAKPQHEWPAIISSKDVPAAPLKPLKAKPFNQSDEIITLGEKLFNDTRLSRDNTVSCASCHESRLAFSDRRKLAVGIDGQVGTRNTQAIIGVDHWQSFFWDGRAKTATEQALMPIENPIEMGTSVDLVLNKVNSAEDYKSPIFNAFGKEALNKELLALALVAFERTFDIPESLFTRFIDKAQTSPSEAVALLNDQQLEGLHLFRTKARCMTCHEGALLSDNEFHITGLHFYGRKLQDLGRFDATQDPADIGKFRTPSLLALQQSTPWMHHGGFQSLLGIVNFYNAGGARPKPSKKFKDDPNYPQTTELLHKLALSKDEKNALIAFLETL
ncbi:MULTISPECIES: cytochrome c peroxidase [Pseudoalteromonas]|uniref:Cytochrome C peroxidase n=1 Tax=Pseudoalteromonas lipolytica TaxID=570156 RepID=A0A0P7DUH9_9GAMM|nr:MULTISPECIES: cytochrome c peroxidase [Pseudoalteromonas]MAH27786.1 cytochrome-c peroxidase [Pseudoalteromonadaceae bacterium]MED5514274.1 cytochrome c peroxidase [Pseudomonadota bacterium]KPM85073.1 cytochrome C peroxidase [Pseudoalteromonas lipolytica]MBC7008201.1 cytochrome-c peroxidase [Pseudoalteromonas sp. BZK2]TMP15072.1 cytochrome-c peroxidase [Pseudoalteromonas sp. S2721]|tara:strand:+ start:432 stop:1502 length:1071 start_codon:yes stop_codon:yes gene_type:complete